MASFIGRILAILAPVILDWLLKKGSEWTTKMEAEKKRREDAKAVREKAEQAQTPEERENASKDLRNNF